MKKTWKRRAAAVLAAGILTVSASILPAWAEETAGTEEKAVETAAGLEEKIAEAGSLSAEAVRIESLGMEMKVPKGWVTITSEMTEDDPVFSENHMDGAAMIKNYKEHSILIDSINMDEKVEFNVTLSGKDDKIVHLTQFSDEDVKKFADELSLNGSGDAVSFSDYEIYDNSQARFIAGEAELNTGGNVAGKGSQYYTIVNGSRLCFQMFSFEGELSEENKGMFRTMIDSVHFDSLQEAGSLSMSRRKNPVLEQLSPKYLLRNVIIVLGAVLVVYYGAEAVRKKKK